MNVPFYIIQDKKKVLVRKIEFTNDIPSLDLAFSHKGKYYKVRKVEKTNNNFQCIVEEKEHPLHTISSSEVKK